MFKRIVKKSIKSKFFSGKIIIIAGARQVGKTTLALDLLKGLEAGEKTKIFNCDNPTDREFLADKNLDFLRNAVGEAKVVLIDEGQKVSTIGQTLKLLADHYKKEKQIVVTGSSSFNLLSSTEEPLTGRKKVFRLFPLSLEEIFPNKDLLTIQKQMESLLIYGSYPEVISESSFDEKIETLKELTSSYLYKDILEFQNIKNPEILTKLLKALALQIGHEVSYTELASVVGIDKNTVEVYIDLLEKNFIIFRLPPFFKNKRKEISKLRKIFFCDLGIRNAIINNFNLLIDRDDVGSLWENFMIIERIKYQNYHRIHANNYFWRTYDGAEIDFVEEREGKTFGYEFKWNKRKRKIAPPESWLLETGYSYEMITPDKILEFVL